MMQVSPNSQHSRTSTFAPASIGGENIDEENLEPGIVAGPNVHLDDRTNNRSAPGAET
jgi:hypothetical protein